MMVLLVLKGMVSGKPTAEPAPRCASVVVLSGSEAASRAGLPTATAGLSACTSSVACTPANRSACVGSPAAMVPWGLRRVCGGDPSDLAVRFFTLQRGVSRGPIRTFVERP